MVHGSAGAGAAAVMQLRFALACCSCTARHCRLASRHTRVGRSWRAAAGRPPEVPLSRRSCPSSPGSSWRDACRPWAVADEGSVAGATFPAESSSTDTVSAVAPLRSGSTCRPGRAGVAGRVAASASAWRGTGGSAGAWALPTPDTRRGAGLLPPTSAPAAPAAGAPPPPPRPRPPWRSAALSW